MTPARLALLLFIGCGTALPFGSRPLAAWAERLPPAAAAAAQHWHAAMTAAGLDRPYDAIHRWVRDALADQF